MADLSNRVTQQNGRLFRLLDEADAAAKKVHDLSTQLQAAEQKVTELMALHTEQFGCQMIAAHRAREFGPEAENTSDFPSFKRTL